MQSRTENHWSRHRDFNPSYTSESPGRLSKPPVYIPAPLSETWISLRAAVAVFRLDLTLQSPRGQRRGCYLNLNSQAEPRLIPVDFLEEESETTVCPQGCNPEIQKIQDPWDLQPPLGRGGGVPVKSIFFTTPRCDLPLLFCLLPVFSDSQRPRDLVHQRECKELRNSFQALFCHSSKTVFRLWDYGCFS